jgi:hypothetical protein
VFIMICNIDDNYTLIVNIRIFVSRNCKTVLFSNSSLVGSVQRLVLRAKEKKNNGSEGSIQRLVLRAKKKTAVKNNCLEGSVCGHLRRKDRLSGRAAGRGRPPRRKKRAGGSTGHGRLARVYQSMK